MLCYVQRSQFTLKKKTVFSPELGSIRTMAKSVCFIGNTCQHLTLIGAEGLPGEGKINWLGQIHQRRRCPASEPGKFLSALLSIVFLTGG